MKHLKSMILESILDDEDTIMDKSISKAMLDKFESMRAKYEKVRKTNAPLDMFGREIKVGDICPSQCIVIPKDQYANFLKIIK